MIDRHRSIVTTAVTGLARLCLALSVALGTALSVESVDVDCNDAFECEDNTSYLPMAAGYLLYLGSWVYGIMDSSNSADRMNGDSGRAAGQGTGAHAPVTVRRC